MARRVDLADSPFFGLNLLGPPTRPGCRARRPVRQPARRRTTDTRPGADDRSRVLQAAAHRRAESVHLLAQASLGGLLVNEGDLDGAQMLLEAAIASESRKSSRWPGRISGCCCSGTATCERPGSSSSRLWPAG